MEIQIQYMDLTDGIPSCSIKDASKISCGKTGCCVLPISEDIMLLGNKLFGID